MAGSFLAAVVAACRAVFGRKPPNDAGAVRVTWAQATIGIVAMATLQAAQLAVQVRSGSPESLRALADFAMLTLLTNAVPFAVAGATALLLKKAGQLPTIFLFLALVIGLLLPVIAAPFNAFGVYPWPLTVGASAFCTAQACSRVLGFRWGGATLVGAVVVFGVFAANWLFLISPTGQAILAAS